MKDILEFTTRLWSLNLRSIVGTGLLAVLQVGCGIKMNSDIAVEGLSTSKISNETLSMTLDSPNGGANFTTSISAQTISGQCSTKVASFTSTLGTFADSDCSDSTWSLNSYNLNSGVNTFTIVAQDAEGNSISHTIVITYDNIPPTLAITAPNSGNDLITGTQSQNVSGTCSSDAINLSSTLGTFSDSNCSDGTWVLNVYNLSLGANTFTISAEDAVGNSVNDAIVITYNNTFPSLAITSPNSGSNFSTATQSQTLSGTCSASAINLQTTLGTFSDSDCSDGTWALNAYNLNAGANTFTISGEDIIGNPANDAIVITYDNTPPSLAVTAPNSGNNLTTATQSQTVSGTCSSDAINLASTIGTFSDSNCGDGTWALNAYNLSVGANTFTISAEDAAGNPVNDAIVITYDNTPPTLAISAPNSGSNFTTGTQSQTVSGTCSTDAISLASTLGTFSDSNCSNGTWALNAYNLSVGANTFTISAQDAAGNPVNDTIVITYDNTPPSLAVTSPNSGNNFTTGTQSQTVSGTCSTDAINLASTLGTFSDSDCSNGTWALNAYNLNVGANTFTISAEDAYGNPVNDAIVITYDNTPPSLAVTAPNSGNNFTTATQSQTVSGTCSTDAINLSSSLGTFSDSDCSNGTWALNAYNLGAGTNTFTIGAQDAYGNSVNDAIVITYDNTPPTLAVSAPNSGNNFSTATQSQTVSGTCSTDAINLASTLGTFSDSDCSNGTWALNAYNLNAGANTFTISAEDAVGNPVNDAIVITYDTTPPSLAITSPNSGNNLTTSTQSQTVSGTCSTDAINLASTLGTFSDSDCSNGTWALNAYSTSAGANTFTISAEDAAGNDIDDTIVITYVAASTVDKVYPSFPNWNDYIKNNNGGTTLYDQPGNACAGTEGGMYTSCIHVGEIRKVVATGQSSCTNLVAADQLGVFNWTCSGATNPVIFYSNGFKPGKGLADLLLVDQFKTNKVTITRTTDSATVVDTTSTVWWDNTVEALSDNSASSVVNLTGSGKIYTLDTSRDTTGYNINADKIAVVTLGTAVMRFTSGSATNCGAPGETGAASYRTVVCTGGQKFLWIEGRFDGNQMTATSMVIYLGTNTTKYSRFHNIYAYNGAGYGFSSNPSSQSVFTNVRVSGNGGIGIGLYADAYNVYDNLVAVNNVSTGIEVGSTTNHSTFRNLLMANNTGRGLQIPTNGSYLTFSLVNSVNNGSHGFQVTGASTNRNTIFGFTSVNNNASGIVVDTATSAYTMVAQAISANNATHGFYTFSTNYNYWSHLVAYRNANNAINAASGSYSDFLSTIWIGSNGANCNNGGSSINLDASCNHGPSTALAPVTGIDLDDTWVGQVTSDSTNTADTSGVETYVNIGNDIDWLLFENIYRAWGKYDVNPFAHNNHRSRCATGTSCQIWDWTIDPADTVIKNHFGTFTAGAACPSSTNPNTAINKLSDFQGNSFLTNAYEILFDNTGDEDGLCESNERCVFMPHFGAYQGHGTLSSSTCTFATGGTITGVSLYGY